MLGEGWEDIVVLIRSNSMVGCLASCLLDDTVALAFQILSLSQAYSDSQ